MTFLKFQSFICAARLRYNTREHGVYVHKQVHVCQKKKEGEGAVSLENGGGACLALWEKTHFNLTDSARSGKLTRTHTHTSGDQSVRQYSPKTLR